MFNKKFIDKVLTPIVVGFVVVFVIIEEILSGRFNQLAMIGFLIGLVLGQIGVHLYIISRGTGKYKRFSHVYSLLTIFIVVFLLAYISKYLSFGYFAGYGIISLFGLSAFTLFKKFTKT